MRNLAVAAGLLVLLASGAIHGRWTNRWQLSTEVRQAAERLRAVPARFGDREGQDVPRDVRQFQQAEADGHVVRRYVHKQTGDEMMLMIVCGRPGPMATHTPEVCYRGAGFEPKADPVRVRREGIAATLWVADFVKERALGPETLRIFWAWGAAGRWTAADNPRISYARQAALYKLYVIRNVPAAGDVSGDKVETAFLGALLPEVDRALFPAG
jgi:hypothetical protein